MNPFQNHFIKIAKHPVKFRMFLFFKLPSVFFSGIKIIDLSESISIVSVPFKWFTKNPFRSTYFACLGMAAELSTGILILQHIYKRYPACSMLVIECKSTFVKKATGNTFFTCTSGSDIEMAIETAYLTNLPQTIIAQSIGRNSLNEIVSQYEFTWSVRVKI